MENTTEMNKVIAGIMEVQVIPVDGFEVLSYRPDLYWESLIPAINIVGVKVRDKMEDFTMFWQDNEIYVQAIEDAVWTDDIDQAYEALVGLINKYSIS
jgi:uncharacterized membrane-anchored protein